jgi:hypothetical protein
MVVADVAFIVAAAGWLLLLSWMLVYFWMRLVLVGAKVEAVTVLQG